MCKSVRQEFVESVIADTSPSLAKRMVSLIRRRESQYGNSYVREQYIKIIRQEILKRIGSRH